MRRKVLIPVLLWICLLLIFSSGDASTIWINIKSVHVFPDYPTDMDSLVVYISGEISTPCDSIWYAYHQIQGNRIDLHLQFYQHQGVCPAVIAPFYLQIPIGTMPVGICTLYTIIDSYPYFWGEVFEVFENSPSGILNSPKEIVDEFALSQNYPNPFNSTTNINYVLSRDAWVTLSVYNSSGQRVKVLENNRQPKGSYSVNWDGKNDSGKGVASGIYFYELKAGEYKETRKLVLIK